MLGWQEYLTRFMPQAFGSWSLTRGGGKNAFTVQQLAQTLGRLALQLPQLQGKGVIRACEW